MLYLEEKVTQEELKETAVQMLREGSFLYRNVEINLYMFDEDQLVLDYIGAFILGARDTVLEQVQSHVFSAQLLPFTYDGKVYHVSFKIELK